MRHEEVFSQSHDCTNKEMPSASHNKSQFAMKSRQRLAFKINARDEKVFSCCLKTVKKSDFTVVEI